MPFSAASLEDAPPSIAIPQTVATSAASNYGSPLAKTTSSTDTQGAQVQQHSLLFQRIANYLDVTKDHGLRHVGFPVWVASVVWCVSRIATAGDAYGNARALYAYTDRPLFDYPYVYQMIAAGLLLIALVYQLLVFYLHRDQFAHATTAVFIQGVVSVSIMMYADGMLFGTQMVLCVLPLIGTLFGGNTLVMIAGWCLATVGVVLMALANRYFESYLRFAPESSPILYAIVYAVVSFLVMGVPQLYHYWLRRAQEQQELLVKFTTEVAELLVSMNTDRAMKIIEEQELSKSDAATAHGSSMHRAAATLRRLTQVFSRYRSYLPSSLFVQGLQDFGDDDDDDAQELANAGAGGEDPNESISSVSSDANRHPRDGSTNMVAPLDPTLLEKSLFRRRWSTILYVSITSAIVEPRDVQDISERFCSAVIPRVVASRGVIDRLGPTSILATFNCHSPCVIHESEAANCALGIAAELSQHVDLTFSIVIASGYNFIGTCGVDMHRARVVLGESVDLVHRLLPLASSTLACRILITEDTANKIGLETAPIDSVQLNPQGSTFIRERLLTLFELRSTRRENAPHSLAVAFSSAFAALRSGDYVNALGMWRNYIDRNPTDFQARRLAALCDPRARERAALMRQLKQSSMGSMANVAPVPYVRHELLWETNKAEEQFVLAQRNEVAAMVVSSTSGTGAATTSNVGFDLFDTVRQHFQAQKLDYQEDGLFSMFLPAEEEDTPGSGEPRPDDQFTQQDALSTEVPRTFDDNQKKRWRRSGNQIGEGAFAQLYLALGELGDLVAMKCFFVGNQRTQTEELIQELQTLSSLRNDYIVGYVGYAVTPNHFIILMEYVSGGSLLSMLHQFGPLPLAAAKRFLIDILKGLRYLHDHHVTHCDIKPHNALLANDGTCKLSDFGSSVNNQARPPATATDAEAAGVGLMPNSEDNAGGNNGNVEGPPNDEQLLVRGTSWYLSPEAAKGEVRPANDIWSLGVTFIEMITGKIPWNYRGSEANFIIMVGKDESMVPILSPDIPEDVQGFLKLCLQRDPAKRPTAQQLLQHPFLN